MNVTIDNYNDITGSCPFGGVMLLALQSQYHKMRKVHGTFCNDRVSFLPLNAIQFPEHIIVVKYAINNDIDFTYSYSNKSQSKLCLMGEVQGSV